MPQNECKRLRPDHQLPDDGGVEGPGLLSCWDDLLSRQEEAVGAGVPELHAGGEEDAGLAMGPVSGAPASNVEHAGNATNLVGLAVHSLQGSLASDSDLQHFVVILREGVGVTPGQQHQLAVAVDAVVEDPVLLPGHDVVADVDILHLRPGLRAVVGVAALVVGAPALVPVVAVVPVGVSSLSRSVW